jgi:hypothetical protein
MLPTAARPARQTQLTDISYPMPILPKYVAKVLFQETGEQGTVRFGSASPELLNDIDGQQTAA